MTPMTVKDHTAKGIIMNNIFSSGADGTEGRLNDPDALLRKVLRQAVLAGIPVSGSIERHVSINTRARSRFGMCIKKDGRFTIEISSLLLQAPEQACCQTIAHELIHTCPGCDNHGPVFRRYAEIMNSRYGYTIQRTNSYEELGLQSRAPAKKEIRYIVVCRSCGKQITRTRMSSVVSHPSRYRCTCGGKLKRIQ